MPIAQTSSVPAETAPSHLILRTRLRHRVIDWWAAVLDVAHGLRLAWICATSVAIGWLLFVLAPQAQDLFLEVRGSVLWGVAHWAAFYAAVVFGWALPVYLSARWILAHFKVGATQWTKEEPVLDWVRDLLPPTLAVGCLGAVLLGQLLALANAPTVLDMAAATTQVADIVRITEAVQDCGTANRIEVLACKAVKLADFKSRYVALEISAVLGEEKVILLGYAAIALSAFWFWVHGRVRCLYPGSETAGAKLSRWGEKGMIVGAKSACAIIPLWLVYSQVTGDAISSSNPFSRPLVFLGIAGASAAAWLSLWGGMRVLAARGHIRTSGMLRVVLNALIFLPIAVVTIAFIKSFVNREMTLSISLGHLAVLPAVTALSMWLLWHGLHAGFDGGASYLRRVMLRLRGSDNEHDNSVAMARLVNSSFQSLLVLSVFAMLLSTSMHPVDVTQHLYRALLAPFALGIMVPAATGLSYWSARTRAPLVIVTLVIGGLIPAMLHDPHDVRTVSTSAVGRLLKTASGNGRRPTTADLRAKSRTGRLQRRDARLPSSCRRQEAPAAPRSWSAVSSASYSMRETSSDATAIPKSSIPYNSAPTARSS